MIGFIRRRTSRAVFEPPGVLDADALLDKAFRRASKATRKKGRTHAERSKNLTIAKIRTAADVVTSTLDSYIRGFPSLDRIHVFYRDLIEATIGLAKLRKSLAAVNWARRKVQDLLRAYPRRIHAASTAEGMARIRAEAYGRFSSVIQQIADALEELQKAGRQLRKFPDIDPDQPTIVVAGPPNVGKSQFVRAVSSGKPRVATYPFTTKGVSLGHVDVRYMRYQVLDTPGLLDRSMEKRNPMERQAIAALSHLADVVVFLLDPTETCGYDLAAQERLLAEIQMRFPEVPILVVENKSDLLKSVSDRPKISALSGAGVRGVFADAVQLATSRVPGAARPRESG